MLKLIGNISDEDFFVLHKSGELIGPFPNSSRLTQFYYELVNLFEKAYPSELYDYVQSVSLRKNQVLFHLETTSENNIVTLNYTDEISRVMKKLDNNASSTKGFILVNEDEKFQIVHSLDYINGSYNNGFSQFSEKDYVQALHHMPLSMDIVYEEKSDCFTEKSNYLMSL